MFDIVRGAPWPAQYPGRALRNDFYQRWHGKEEQLQAERADAEKGYLATKPDDFSARVIWAGEGVDLVKDVPSAAELIERIVAEAASVLARGARMVRPCVTAQLGGFGAEAPHLEAFGRRRLERRIAYLATIRADGSPRVHPVSPFIGGGCLAVYMEPTSPRRPIFGAMRAMPCIAASKTTKAARANST